MEAGHSQEGGSIRVRSERELNCLGEWPPQQELERVSPKREPRELPEPQEVERVSPKREPRELPEPQEFEFVGVKQEPLEQPEDDEFLPQEPECVLEQKDEERGVDARTGGLRRTQEPEYIVVQKEDGEQPGVGERALIQVHENGVVQQPAAIGAGTGTGTGCAREEEEILGLVAEVPWVAPCVPATADPLTSGGDAVTDSKNGEFYTLGWGHTSGEVDHYRPAATAASSGGPPSDSFAAQSCRNAGPEPTRRAFRCDSCSVIFSSKYHLVNHVFTHIAEVPPPSHVCRWCAEVFCDTASLLEHSKGHESRPEAPARSTVEAEPGVRQREKEAQGPETSRNEAPRLSPVWQGLPLARKPEPSRSDALRREAVRVRHLREVVRAVRPPAEPQADAHRREAALLRVLRARLLPPAHPEGAPAHAHGREAVQLRGVRRGLPPAGHAQDAPADPHRQEAVRVRRVRQVLRRPQQPEEAQADALG